MDQTSFYTKSAVKSIIMFSLCFWALAFGMQAQSLLDWELVPSANDPSLYDLEISYGTLQEQGPWLTLAFRVTPDSGFNAENYDQTGTFLNSDGNCSVTIETNPDDGTVTYTLDRTGHGAMTGAGKVFTLLEVGANTGVEEWLEMKTRPTAPVLLGNDVKAPQLSVWPSTVPALGTFHWEINESNVNQVWLLSMEGVRIPLDNQPGRVEVENLKPGLYYLVVETTAGVINRKLFIE